MLKLIDTFKDEYFEDFKSEDLIETQIADNICDIYRHLDETVPIGIDLFVHVHDLVVENKTSIELFDYIFDIEQDGRIYKVYKRIGLQK